MEKEIIEIMPQVIELYLLASDPLFLFVSLRSLSSIKILSEKYSTNELMIFYSKKKTDEDIEGLCLYYIILTILSFKPYEEASKHLQSLSKKKYIWAGAFVDLILSCFKSIQVEPIILEEQIEIENVSVQKDRSTNQKFENTHINKPVIQQPDDLRNFVTDSTTNITFKDKKNEN